jgi:5'-nucleotidase
MVNILVTNDDGIQALGIRKLVTCLGGWANVFVVAPKAERSAVGHGITVREPLMIEEVDFYGMKDVQAWSVNGNPADCVKVALHVLLNNKPDFILSGINAGLNLGKDVYYSGTISAAREGVIHGIPSIAISYDNHFHQLNFGEVEKLLIPVLKSLQGRSLPEQVLFNVNIPHVRHDELKGVTPCSLQLHHYSDRIDRKKGLEGEEFWLERHYDQEPVAQTDYSLLNEGYITITPIHIDSTDKNYLEMMKKWDWND